MSSSTTPAPTNSEPPPEIRVTFYPPLHLQRRVAALNVLREHSVSSVLDVGCGEGELLGVLARPAPWLPRPSLEQLVAAVSAHQGEDEDDENDPGTARLSKEEIEDLASRHLQTHEDVPSLHARSIAGLDISSQDLAFAVASTVPPPLEQVEPDYGLGSRVDLSEVRWEELTAKIWHGSLDVVNEDFVDIECVVAKEVIEHLPPEIFPTFAPTILGIYHPKILLVTTPSYTFNARFSPPDTQPTVLDPSSATPQAREGGFLDPTGRTQRVFRHSDHKFEMTVDEFTQWCNEAAQTYGYQVKCWTVGKPIEDDPWGRDDETFGGASQVAEFLRLDDNESSTRRTTAVSQYQATRSQLNARTTSPSQTDESGGLNQESRLSEPHVLLSESQHPVHPSAERPQSFSEIAELVKQRMISMRDTFIRVEEFWFQNNDIAIACGGWVEWLTLAIDLDGGFTPGPSTQLGSDKEATPARDRLVLIRDAAASPQALRDPIADMYTSPADLQPGTKRSEWTIQLITQNKLVRPTWSTDAETSFDSIPEGWMPDTTPSEEHDDYMRYAESESLPQLLEADNWNVVHEVEGENAEWGEDGLLRGPLGGGNSTRAHHGGEEAITSSESELLKDGQNAEAWGRTNPWGEEPGGFVDSNSWGDQHHESLWDSQSHHRQEATDSEAGWGDVSHTSEEDWEGDTTVIAGRVDAETSADGTMGEAADTGTQSQATSDLTAQVKQVDDRLAG